MITLALLGSTILCTLGPVKADESFKWHTDLDAATARAAKEGKPLLLVFR